MALGSRPALRLSGDDIKIHWDKESAGPVGAPVPVPHRPVPRGSRGDRCDRPAPLTHTVEGRDPFQRDGGGTWGSSLSETTGWTRISTISAKGCTVVLFSCVSTATVVVAPVVDSHRTGTRLPETLGSGGGARGDMS